MQGEAQQLLDIHPLPRGLAVPGSRTSGSQQPRAESGTLISTSYMQTRPSSPACVKPLPAGSAQAQCTRQQRFTWAGSQSHKAKLISVCGVWRDPWQLHRLMQGFALQSVPFMPGRALGPTELGTTAARAGNICPSAPHCPRRRQAVFQPPARKQL